MHLAVGTGWVLNTRTIAMAALVIAVLVPLALVL
jgi:hypothetical protein